MKSSISYYAYQNPHVRNLSTRLHLDIPLLVGLLLLITLGLAVLYSASGENLARITRQLVHLAIGFVVMIGLAQVSPKQLKGWTPWVYLAGVAMLVAVLSFGYVGKGAQRWLNLGFFRFQPSELVKLAVPMMVAWFLANRRPPPDFLRLIGTAILIMVPVGLIAKQPDLGTSLLVAVAGLFVLFLAGLSWRLIFTALAGLPLAAWATWLFYMKDYQKQRVLTFLNPESDPLGSGYHIIQSTIAVGSGGSYGKGWMNGTQSQLDFLPERTTDFIFAVYGEEFGLTGGILLLLLYLFIAGRGLMLATQAQDSYGRLLAGSLSLTFLVYVVVNIGMVIGLLPVVGVPLPLVSYGGTSIVTLMAGFGILMSVHTHRSLLSR